MEEDFPDWKPDGVKLESELILEDVLETDAYCPASHLDGSHRAPSARFVETNPVSSKRICPNLASSLSTRPNSAFNMSQEVKIKEEVEDVTPFPDFQMDDCYQNLAQTAPSAHHVENSLFLPEIIYFKTEDNFIEGNNIAKEEPLQFDFVETNEERIKDPFHDVGCPVSTISTPPAILGIRTASAPAAFEVESMGNALEGNNTCNETTSALDFGFIKVETVSDLDSDDVDAKMETDIEPGLKQHTAFAEVRSCSKFKSVDCTRVMDTDKCVIPHVSKQTNIGSSKSAAFSSDQPSMCSEKEYDSRQSIKQYVSQKLFTALAKRNANLNKEWESPSDTRLFCCDQCSANFSEKSKLTEHSAIHSSEKAFSCDQCPAKFSRKSNLKTHSIIHSGKKAFSCDQCPAQFKLKAHLKKHSLTHSGEKSFSCDQCSERFKQKGHLNEHSAVHSDNRAFSCDQCPAKFSRKSNLKTHSIIHSGEKAFSCDQCPAQFKLKAHLKRHSLTHSGEKSFSCDQCSERFRLKAELNEHSAVHSGERMFPCDLCPAKFSRKSKLRRHALFHSGEKAFSCDRCTARFKLKCHLKVHSLIHSGEKPFQCDQCPAKFSQKSNLKTHSLIHSAEKAFSCDQCSAKFSQKNNLKVHSLIHSGKRAFPLISVRHDLS